MEAVLGGREWKREPPLSLSCGGLIYTDPRTGLGSSMRKRREEGKKGTRSWANEQLQMRLFARCAELEKEKVKLTLTWVEDSTGRPIVCDAE